MSYSALGQKKVLEEYSKGIGGESLGSDLWLNPARTNPPGHQRITKMLETPRRAPGPSAGIALTVPCGLGVRQFLGCGMLFLRHCRWGAEGHLLVIECPWQLQICSSGSSHVN